jgi:LPXTG-motif cell wall-anchored protein
MRTMRVLHELKFVLAAVAVGVFGVIFGMPAAQALEPGDFGPPPKGEFTTCGVNIDPPISVDVTIVVTIDGVEQAPITKPYFHNLGAPFVPFDLTDILTPGTHHVSVSATWPIGTGALVLETDMHCSDPPPPPPPTTTTTTTVAAPTTVAPPTTAQVKASEVALATESKTASNASDTTEVEGTGLPNTGTDSGPLLLLGGGFIAVGALAIRGSRRWRSAR